MNGRYRALALAGLVALSVLLPTLVAPAGADTQAGVGIDYEGESVTVANGSAQTISGTADLPEGESVEIRIRATGDTQPKFFKTESATVDGNGTWSATFDFSEQTAGGTFNVTVEAGDATANATGEIVACDGGCVEPTPEPDDGVAIDYEGDAVTVANGSTQVVSGTAAEPTGTEIVVSLRSTGDTRPNFFRTSTAVVTEDGTWATAFNFSFLDAGATFSVEASTEDGTNSATAEAEVVRCGGDCADTPPSDTPTPIPEQTTTATPGSNGSDEGAAVELTESVVDTVRGDVATIDIRFDGADTATLTVGSEAAGYVLDLQVRDADGDGEATVYFDTELAGREGETVSVSSGDELSVRSEDSLPAALDAGEYDLQVAAAGADGNSDVGTLFVSEADPRATDSTTPTDAPAGNDDVTGLLVS
ncbi:BGTF surface domain-containing protein, partial [Halolamina salina]